MSRHLSHGKFTDVFISPPSPARTVSILGLGDNAAAAAADRSNPFFCSTSSGGCSSGAFSPPESAKNEGRLRKPRAPGIILGGESAYLSFEPENPRIDREQSSKPTSALFNLAATFFRV